MTELLAMFKLSIGELSDDNALDNYYLNKLLMAHALLKKEDISETELSSDTGMFATILVAKDLMNDKDFADNKSINLLRNLLSASTKGERHK